MVLHFQYFFLCQLLHSLIFWEELKKLKELVEVYPVSYAVFGDIDIESHKAWEEKVSDAANLSAVLPLWQGDRRQLVFDMIDAGIEAVIVSCNNDLGSEFLGQTITIELVETLENMGIDACGENGEFHTLVVNTPFFKNKIEVEIKDKEIHNNYHFANLVLKN